MKRSAARSITRVGGGEDRLGRAVVAVERDDLGRRAELPRESRGCCAPLRRGTNRSTARRRRPRSDRGPSGFSASRIEDCSRLVSWYSSTSTWSKRAPISAGQHRIADRLRPVEQQVVVIEHVLRLLGLDIGREQLAQLGLPSGAPGKVLAQHLVERQLGIDGARVDRKARAPWWETGFPSSRSRARAGRGSSGRPQSSRSWMVKVGIEPDLLGILAQQPRADGVKRARPMSAHRS